jgi:hypothetical protein
MRRCWRPKPIKLLCDRGGAVLRNELLMRRHGLHAMSNYGTAIGRVVLHRLWIEQIDKQIIGLRHELMPDEDIQAASRGEWFENFAQNGRDASIPCTPYLA